MIVNKTNLSASEYRFQSMDPILKEIAARYYLTPREIEILELIVLRGYTNRELADYFIISEKTVKNHISSIMNKTRVGSIRKVFSILFQHIFATRDVTRISQDAQYDEAASTSGSGTYFQ